MSESKKSDKKEITYPFLSGGGEMGLLTRTKDWSKTSLGTPDTWPQSLRTTLSIIINSKFPMFLWWGPDLVCFYNDAYRPSLGQDGKHPHILGMKAPDAWEEIWDIIKPLIDQVLEGKGATWSEDQLIPIFRNGKIENVYWTFSYSPVNDETGKTNGVLVTCFETTDKVNLLQQIKESKEQLEFAIDATALGTWEYNPITGKLEGNSQLREWFGLPHQGPVELPVALNVVAEEDRERLVAAIDEALDFASGGKFQIDYSIVHPLTGEKKIVRAKGSTSFTDDAKASRFNGTLQDITGWVTARNEIEKSEKLFRNILKQAPLGITILHGPSFIVEMANKTYLEIVGRTEEDFVGKSLFETLPEVRDAVEPLLKGVLDSGEPFYGTEFPVKINRYGTEEISYFNFVYHPLRDENQRIPDIIVVAMEVTESVKAKLMVAESERRFKSLVMQSPIPMAILMGADHTIGLANQQMKDNIWRKKSKDVLGKNLLDVFPELASQKYPELLREVFTTGTIHREAESVVWVEGDDGLREFFLDFEYAPLFDSEGAVSGIMVTASDVTEKVLARQKVEDAEERLRLAVEAAELATWELDLETEELFSSPRLAEIFGVAPGEEIKYRNLRGQIHPVDLSEVVEKAFAKALETGLYQYEARILRPDKKNCWIRTQGKVIYDQQRKPVKVIGTIRDITDEKLHERELQESEEKFRLLADSMPQHVWTANPDGEMNYFNRAVYDFSGLTVDDIKKDGWLKIIHPDEKEENMRQWMEAIKTGKDFLFENRFRRYDGEYRWQLSRAKPQLDAQGNIQMWVGTSTDIQQIKEMDQQKDLFISMASHELKTPITSIRGYAQVLQVMYQSSGDALLLKSLNSIDRQVEKLMHLISDLLDLSKIKSGKLQLNTEVFYIKDLVKEVVNEIRHIYPDFTIDVLRIPPAKVFADKERIGQVIINFLTNAVKYSPTSRKVSLDCEVKDEMIVVSVQDSGIGINKTDQEKIFQRFYRVEGKNQKTFPGFGIGLFISLEIINRHDGKIGVTSEPGKGSVFYFSLPVHKSESK